MRRGRWNEELFCVFYLLTFEATQGRLSVTTPRHVLNRSRRSRDIFWQKVLFCSSFLVNVLSFRVPYIHQVHLSSEWDSQWHTLRGHPAGEQVPCERQTHKAALGNSTPFP